MSDATHRVQITDQDEAVAATERQRAREAEAEAARRDGVVVRTGDSTRIAFSGDQVSMQTERGTPNRAVVQTQDPGVVTLPNGWTTSPEAAKMAGFEISEDGRATDPKLVGPTPGQPQGQQTQQLAPQSPATAAQKSEWMRKNSAPEMQERFFDLVENGTPAESQYAMDKLDEVYAKARGGRKTQQSQNKDGVSYSSQAERVADQVLQAADRQLGAEAVTDIMSRVAELGDMENLADVLPEGFPVEKARTAIEGYRAYANRLLSDVGISGVGLSAVLADHELATVRRAVVARDEQAIQSFGDEARDRLSRLPAQEPDKFLELSKEVWPGAVKRDEEGKLYVHTDKGRVAASVAIQMKLLRM